MYGLRVCGYFITTLHTNERFLHFHTFIVAPAIGANGHRCRHQVVGTSECVSAPLLQCTVLRTLTSFTHMLPLLSTLCAHAHSTTWSPGTSYVSCGLSPLILAYSSLSTIHFLQSHWPLCALFYELEVHDHDNERVIRVALRVGQGARLTLSYPYSYALF